MPSVISICDFRQLMQVFDSFGAIITPHMQQRLRHQKSRGLHPVGREKSRVKVTLVVLNQRWLPSCMSGDTAHIVILHVLVYYRCWPVDLGLKENVLGC